MKIIVTGGAGFIGSNLVRLLWSRGHEVLNLDKLTYAGSLDSLKDLQGQTRYHFQQADICDAEAVQTAFMEFQPDALAHLAAESHVDRSIDGPGAFIETNMIGTYTLLQAALQYWRMPSPASFLFLHVSTDEVYGSLGESGKFTEGTPYDPRSPYSASKAASDHLVRAWYHTYGLPVIVTACSNNYGPCQFPEKLVPLVILKCLRGEPIPVYGNGGNVRDWLYVQDHAEALLKILENGKPGQTYHIGGNNECRNIDLVRMLCGILDEEAPKRESLRKSKMERFEELITFVSDRPGHDWRYAMDATKIQEELEWQPREQLDTGLRKTVQWYLQNRDWWEHILAGEFHLQRLGSGNAFCQGR